MRSQDAACPDGVPRSPAVCPQASVSYSLKYGASCMHAPSALRPLVCYPLAAMTSRPMAPRGIKSSSLSRTSTRHRNSGWGNAVRGLPQRYRKQWVAALHDPPAQHNNTVPEKLTRLKPRNEPQSRSPSCFVKSAHLCGRHGRTSDCESAPGGKGLTPGLRICSPTPGHGLRLLGDSSPGLIPEARVLAVARRRRAGRLRSLLRLLPFVVLHATIRLVQLHLPCDTRGHANAQPKRQSI